MSSTVASWVTGLSTAAMAVLVGYQAYTTREILDDHIESNVHKVVLDHCVSLRSLMHEAEPLYAGIPFGLAVSDDISEAEECKGISRADPLVERLADAIVRAALVFPTKIEVPESRMLGGLGAFEQYLDCTEPGSRPLSQATANRIVLNVNLLFEDLRRLSAECRDEFARVTA